MCQESTLLCSLLRQQYFGRGKLLYDSGICPFTTCSPENYGMDKHLQGSIEAWILAPPLKENNKSLLSALRAFTNDLSYAMVNRKVSLIV